MGNILKKELLKKVEFIQINLLHDQDDHHAHVFYKPFTNFLFQNQKADDLGTWYEALGFGPYQNCTNDDYRLTLTYFTTKSIFIPNAFILEF